MTLAGWFSWLRVESFGRPVRVLLTVVCVIASVTTAAMMIHAIAWLRFEVRPEVERLFPRQRILVEPTGMDVVFLRLQAGNLTEEVVNRLRRLQGVAAVHAQMAAEFPAMVEISLPGMDDVFSSEAALFGVAREMIEAELPAGAAFSSPTGNAPVPVMASAYFLDVYNLGIAESNRLPKLTERAAIGREFDLLLGLTTIGASSRSQVRTVRARVVGLTRETSLVGIVVPVEVLSAWNREFSRGWEPRYIRVMVDAESPDAALRLREEIEAMGLRTTMAAENLERYGQVIAAAEIALGVLLASILLLAAVGVASTVAMSARERRASWGIQRAMGMRPGTLVMLVTGEGLLVALFCGAVASGLCIMIMAGAEQQFGEIVEGLAFLPGDPLSLGAVTFVGIGLITIFLVVTPLTLSALAASRVEPIKLLAERSL